MQRHVLRGVPEICWKLKGSHLRALRRSLQAFRGSSAKGRAPAFPSFRFRLHRPGAGIRLSLQAFLVALGRLNPLQHSYVRRPQRTASRFRHPARLALYGHQAGRVGKTRPLVFARHKRLLHVGRPLRSLGIEHRHLHNHFRPCDTASDSDVLDMVRRIAACVCDALKGRATIVATNSTRHSRTNIRPERPACYGRGCEEVG